MRAALQGTLRTAIIAEATAAHLDLYLEAIAACSGLGPTGYSDPTGVSADAARKSLPDAEIYRSVPELLASIRPELTIVLMEPGNVPQAILAALQAGSHVLAEKHPVATSDQLQSLFAAAEANGRHLILVLPKRALPEVAHARELVESGRLGDFYAADLLVAADQARLWDPVYRQSWRCAKAKSGGGILMAMGIHQIDLLHFLTGLPTVAATAFCTNAGGSPVDIEDSVAAALRLANGGLAGLHAGFYLDTSYQSSITLWLSKGWLQIPADPENPLCWYRHGTEQIQRFAGGGGADATQSFLQQTIDRIVDGTAPMVSTQSGLHLLETVFAIYRSAATGATVDLNVSVPKTV